MSLTVETLPVVHHTFVLERNYQASSQRVFQALSDPAKKRRWFGEGDHHNLEMFEMDFRVGGIERAQYRFRDGVPFAGTRLLSETTFLDIVPGTRVVSASTMTMGERRISAALVTFDVRASAVGSRLLLTHQAAFFEGADGPVIRKDGWRALLEKFAREV